MLSFYFLYMFNRKDVIIFGNYQIDVKDDEDGV